MAKSLIGQVIGKYQVVEVLGRGGMAEVYKAYQESLDRYVAIKVMHSFLADEEDFLNRFQREARSMASLNHRNIVKVYDFDVQDGTYYIVMEYLGGGTLKNQLEIMARRRERLPLANTVKIVLEIADALAYAHARGMIHRDIKPGNIMLNEQGEAVLTDFGIAKILSGPSFTATGAMIGTPAYMAPEQGLGGSGDERSDLYALGVLFFQMASGQLPYDADTPLAIILKHVNDPVPDIRPMNTDLPPDIQAVILKAMAKDPEVRYQTAEEMAADLRGAVRNNELALGAGTVIVADLLRESPTPRPFNTDPDRTQVAEVVAPPPPPPSRAVPGQTEISRPIPIVPAAPKEKKSRAGIIILAILLLVIFGAAGAFFLFRGGGGDNDATPTVPAVAEAQATSTTTPAPTATEPRATIDTVATAAAAVAATLTAVPTNTPLPTPTIRPSETPTPDATATYLAGCVSQVTLVDSYTYQNPQSNTAQARATFPMNWILRNDGTCPLPAGSLWSYQEGEEFDQEGPVSLEEELLPGQETTLTATFIAPSQSGTYESTWALLGPADVLLGEPLVFEVRILTPASPTPNTPTPTVTPSPVPSPTGEIQPLGYQQNVVNCEYDGGDWRCELAINPYGGVGPYTLFVFDAEPPVEYSGSGPFIHPFVSGRCFPWVHEIRLQDDATGQLISENIYIDPDNYFPGGCTLPQ